MTAPLLQVEDLEVIYPGGPRALRKPVLHGVSLEIRRGEVLALMGASGSGKTTLAKALVGLVPLARGRIRLDGREIRTLSGKARQEVRRQIQLAFQAGESALDPAWSVSQSMKEALVIHQIGTPLSRQERVRELLRRVGLPDSAGDLRPTELSGGQRQRVVLARALMLEPSLLIVDEPTSALDVSVQVQILDLLEQLRSSLGIACLLLSHDRSAVRYLSDRVALMHQGRITEVGPTAEVLGRLDHGPAPSARSESSP